MAVKTMGYGGDGAFQDDDGILYEYVCDTVSDVGSLPTGEGETDWTKKPRPGSRALVLETTDVYVLNSQRAWQIIT